ncbi:MAG: hypothetical protein JWP58_4361, partial [Hymenobacter sp.]|nr:hypothetical protein [Hymenobacter sp.]
MGLFDKLLGRKPAADEAIDPAKTTTVQLQKGETFISAGDDYLFKIVRPLTEEQSAAIDKSTILLRTGPLYMHYWTDNLICPDRNDPEWQNKVMFFWKAEEPFSKKSLPPEFEKFKSRYF